MAVTERLEMLLTANGSQAIAEFQKTGVAAQKSLNEVDNSSARLGANLVRVGAGMAALGGVMLVGLYKAAQAAEEEQAAVDRLNNSIANSPELAGASTDAFLDQAAALQDVTTFADDATISAQALLGTFNLTQDEILGLTPLVADLAAKFDMDLNRAAMLVGKAMDGNAGALGRMGVRIDQNAFAADRYSAVMEALRENAGGFAEQEGARFSGRIEILKNNLGDLAEGLGRGAVDGFNMLLGPVKSVSAAFEELPDGAQRAAGAGATLGAAGLVAAGGMSMLAGAAVNTSAMLTTLQSAAVGTRVAVALLNPAVAALGVVAGAAAVGGLAALGHSMTGVSVDAQEAIRAVSAGTDELAEEAARWVAIMSPEEMTSALDEIGQSSIIAAQRIGDALIAAGADADLVNGQLRETATVNQQVADDAAANAAAQEELAAGMGGTAVSAEELADAYDNLTSKIDEYLGRIQGSEEAAVAEAEAQAAWQQSLLENGNTYDINTEAGRENIRNRNAWIESVAGQIQAAAEYGAITGDTETAQRRMNGAVRSAVGDLRRARDAGLITSDQFDSLRRRIEKIPRDVPLAVGPIEGYDGTMDQLQAIYDQAQRAATAVGQIGGSLAGGGTYRPGAASSEPGGRSRPHGPEAGAGRQERAPYWGSRSQVQPVVIVGGS